MQLIHDDTAKVVEQGAMIHMISGPKAGQAWRFEQLVDHPTEGHHVHVTRSDLRRGGRRLHRQYHPSVFGCSVAAEVKWYANKVRFMQGMHFVVLQIVLLTLGGLIAALVAEFGNEQWGGFLALLGYHAAE